MIAWKFLVTCAGIVALFLIPLALLVVAIIWAAYIGTAAIVGLCTTRRER